MTNNYPNSSSQQVYNSDSLPGVESNKMDSGLLINENGEQD